MIEIEGRKIPNELSEIVEPNRTVLLVWDMQNDQAASARIKTVYTRQTPYLWKDESPAWIHRFMKEQKVDHPSKLKPRRLHGSFGWQIMEPFKPGENDIVIDKRRPTMFVGNEFETVLSNRRAHTIVMIGCTTDGGVEATVRDGYHRGYFMVVVRDCVGTYTEEGHNAALKRMERFGDVVGSQELMQTWRR